MRAIENPLTSSIALQVLYHEPVSYNSVEKKKNQPFLFWLGNKIVNILFFDTGEISFFPTKLGEVT